MSHEIYERAIKTFGPDKQVEMLIEEMAELMVAISHFWRGKAKLEQVCEEIVDVEIMLDQAKMIFDSPVFDHDYAKEFKLKRLEQRLGG